MGKQEVFVTRMIPREGIDLLEESFRVEVNPHDRPLSREELLEAIHDKQGVLGLLTDRIDSAFFDAAPSLKGYANYAVGFDNIDLAEATRRGIPVSNTPDVLTNATAEMAWALLFAICRRVVESDGAVRRGQWKGWGPMQFVGGGVAGRTLGIVGAGRIGTAMALMSRGFDMKVVYAARSRNTVLEDKLGATLVPMDQLVKEADFISIHTPLTPDTRHLFDATAFENMKETAYLINTARGPVIHEADLVHALKSGQIAGAGLDVYEFEPQLTAGLADLDNVVVAAHTGSGTRSSRRDMALMAAGNLSAMLRGEKATQCINSDVYT